MNKNEARQLLQAQLAAWRVRSYTELCGEVGRWRRFEATGQSGAWYQGDIQVFWDAGRKGAVRVVASIDDGGWRTFVPLTEDFILTPDGRFLGE
jgi:hypothetical protein